MAGSRKPWQISKGMPDDLVTTAVAAKYVGRPQDTIHRLRDECKLRGWHLGYHLVWSLRELRRYLEAREGRECPVPPEIQADVLPVHLIPPDAIAPAEAARIVGCSNVWLSELRARGRIPAVYVGPMTCYSRSVARRFAVGLTPYPIPRTKSEEVV